MVRSDKFRGNSTAIKKASSPAQWADDRSWWKKNSISEVSLDGVHVDFGKYSSVWDEDWSLAWNVEYRDANIMQGLDHEDQYHS